MTESANPEHRALAPLRAAKEAAWRRLLAAPLSAGNAELSRLVEEHDAASRALHREQRKWMGYPE